MSDLPFAQCPLPGNDGHIRQLQSRQIHFWPELIMNTLKTGAAVVVLLLVCLTGALARIFGLSRLDNWCAAKLNDL